MSRTATVVPEDGLNLRRGPSRDTESLGLLQAGQQVTITATASPSMVRSP